jgi:hypothetical protein
LVGGWGSYHLGEDGNKKAIAKINISTIACCFQKNNGALKV